MFATIGMPKWKDGCIGNVAYRLSYAGGKGRVHPAAGQQKGSRSSRLCIQIPVVQLAGILFIVMADGKGHCLPAFALQIPLGKDKPQPAVRDGLQKSSSHCISLRQRILASRHFSRIFPSPLGRKRCPFPVPAAAFGSSPPLFSGPEIGKAPVSLACGVRRCPSFGSPLLPGRQSPAGQQFAQPQSLQLFHPVDAIAL